MSDSRVVSADGTELQVWCNDADGIPLLICNGLASSPAAWPGLLDPDCGFDARTWYHRGIPPSAAPDPGRVGVPDHVQDALAVVEDAGWERYLVVGWSLGVNVALELAARDERVAGVLALAGVPGGTFDAILTAVGVPGEVGSALSGFVTSVLAQAGDWLTPLAGQVAQMPGAADLLRRTGAISQRADIDQVRRLLSDFLSMDVGWYGRLAAAMRHHPPMDVSEITCPVVYISGDKDFVTDPAAVETAAAATPQGSVERWDAGHFMVLEYPDRILDTLQDLADQVEMKPA